MAGGPPDSRYITSEVPAEMRPADGLEEGVVAPATERRVMDADGVTRQLVQIRLPRPEHIPAGPPRLSMPLPALESQPPLGPMSRGGNTLSYAFALLPDVQCRIELQGPARAEHLEQLIEMLTVQSRRLREHETKSRSRPRQVTDEHTGEVQETQDAPPRKKRKVKGDAG